MIKMRKRKLFWLYTLQNNVGWEVDDGGKEDTGYEFFVGMRFEFPAWDVDQGGNEAAEDDARNGVDLELICGICGLGPKCMKAEEEGSGGDSAAVDGNFEVQVIAQGY